MKLILLAFIVASTSAFAIKGDYADKKEELGSSCKLVFKIWDASSKKVLSGICSSSFVGKKSFLTADHCLDTTLQSLGDIQKGLVKETPYFVCPDSEKHYPVKDVQSFKGAGYNGDYDLGVLKVEGVVTAPALDLPTSTAQVDELLKDPSKCFINGYGYDNEDKYGVLKAAQIVELDPKPLSFDMGAPPAVRITKNIGVHGDSGGPMFCRAPRGPVLVGVIHGKMIGEMKYTDLHRVDKVVDWINYHRNGEKTSNDTFSYLGKIQDTCQSVDQCFVKLEASAKLSKDVAAILKKINLSAEGLRARAIAGETIDKKTLDQKWEEILGVWNKQDCYKVLYP